MMKERFMSERTRISYRFSKVLLALLATLCLVSACNKEAPPVTLQLLEGNVLQPSDWQGKWVYINYWAEWCKPCAEEIPELNKFAETQKNVLVVGVNFDNPPPVEALKQLSRMRIGFAIAMNDSIQQVFPHTVPTGLPGTVVVNPEGKVVTTLQGPQTASTLLQAQTSR